MALLELKNLSLEFSTKRGPVQALRSVSLRVEEGEAVGLVGESGSGKSITSLAVMGLLPGNARISGDIRFEGERRLAMIFQDPMTSLNPSFTVGFQMADVLKIHQKTPSRLIREKSLSYLNLVGIRDAEAKLQAYPHQLSGGLAQRVMIALAMACEPRLLIADEPTTALDVTIQAQVLGLIRDIQRERGLSLLLISHDMGVIAQNTARVAVMYAGEIVEEGPTARVIAEPRHPYTRALLDCLPSIHSRKNADDRLPAIPGMVPDLLMRPGGCQFRDRCPKAQDVCRQDVPFFTVGEDRVSRCYFA